MEKIQKRSNIIAGIRPLEVRDATGRQYNGFAYLNFVRVGKRNYVNILCKIKFRTKGEWKDLEQYMILIPIPALDQLTTWIRKAYGIPKPSGKNHRRWEFWVRKDADKF